MPGKHVFSVHDLDEITNSKYGFRVTDFEDHRGLHAVLIENAVLVPEGYVPKAGDFDEEWTPYFLKRGATDLEVIEKLREIIVGHKSVTIRGNTFTATGVALTNPTENKRSMLIYGKRV
jgi:hypothetical protein